VSFLVYLDLLVSVVNFINKRICYAILLVLAKSVDVPGIVFDFRDTDFSLIFQP